MALRPVARGGTGKSPGKGPAGSGEALSPTLLAGRSASAVASQPIALCLLRGRGCRWGRLCHAFDLRPVRL